MKKIKDKMRILGLNPKKEFIILISVNAVLIILAVLLFLITKQILMMAIFIGLAFVFSLLYLTRYGKQIDAINQNNLEEFANLFSYFKIYINNGFSVYGALKEITYFANPNLKEKLENLVKEIDDDKSVQPFVKFGKQFNEIIIEEMMISIYQLIDDGESSEYLIQFELIFDKFSEVLYQKSLKHKDARLGTLSSAPLIGSCFLMIVLTIGIVGIIGELINGI